MPEQQSDEIFVKLTDVCLSFNDKKVLEHISFDVPAGKILTIIGPNGAGKTTLIRLILGILSPDSGVVWKKEGLKIGYVPQKINLPRSIALNVAGFLCLEKKHSPAEMCDVLAQTGLSDDILKADMHTLSGGQTQRVMLARTLLKRPELLVLDEPAQGLDPAGEELFYDLIDKLNKTRGQTIVMVSHDLHIVMAKTDKVLCINHHLCCSGKPDEISAKEDYHHLFGDEAGLAVYHHHHNHRHLPDGSIEACHVD